MYSILFFIYFNAIISHFRCTFIPFEPNMIGTFSDPGAVPSNATYLSGCSEDEKLSYCAKCEAYKPPRAHHCSSCNRCIIRMDHHCPWVNNCVGYRNMKFFLLFLAYTLCMCIFTFIMDIFRLYFVYAMAEEVDDTKSMFISTLSY